MIGVYAWGCMCDSCARWGRNDLPYRRTPKMPNKKPPVAWWIIVVIVVVIIILLMNGKGW